MKKVLIITYYWPPSGGAGVQRWLKFAKYLPEFGWEPIVYTPENPEAPAIDTSLMSDIPEKCEVIKKHIWEPYNLYKIITGKKKSDKIHSSFLTEKKQNGRINSMSAWIRGNLFIPDAKKYWIKPSVRFLKKHLTRNQIDLLVSTGPPHSMHIIGFHLHSIMNIPWIADFRDPWTNIDFYNQLHLSKYANKKHHMLEQTILSKADRVIVVGETMKSEFESISNRKVNVITNGFDQSDFKEIKEVTNKFLIIHTGSLNKDRNPEILWRALKDCLLKVNGLHNDLEILFVGQIDISVQESIERNNLADFVKKESYQHHSEIPSSLQKASLLLLSLNKTKNAKGILTGKLFEYIAAKRPILLIGPENGDAAKIINELKAGACIDFNNSQKIEKVLIQYYDQYKRGSLILEEARNIDKYSRKNLTKELVDLFNEVS